MEIRSNHIFLPNPYAEAKYTEEKEDGTLVVDLRHGFMAHFTAAFPGSSKLPEHSDAFRSMYTCDIATTKGTVEAKFIVHNVSETYYVSSAVSAASRPQLIQALEYIQSAFFSPDWIKDYVPIVSYDAVSEYYCNKIYPKLNELERDLRRLLLNIYTLKLGINYYQETISSELQRKVKNRLRIKGNKKSNEIKKMQEFFYSLEFGDMEELLFTAHWTAVDDRAKDEFLSQHTDLSKLSDEELRKAYLSVAPKSDWERFFADKIDVQVIRTLLNEVRENRNLVAHSKFFDRNKYNTCLKAIKKLNHVITSAIEATEAKDFYAKNTEGIRKAFEYSYKRFAEYKTAVATMQETLQELAKLLRPYSHQPADTSGNTMAAQIQNQLQKTVKPGKRRKLQIQSTISNATQTKKHKNKGELT